MKIGRERLRQILRKRGISFQRTRTWRESRGPGKNAKLDRIEEVTSRFPNRCFTFDQFGAPAGLVRSTPPGCLRPTTVPTASAANANHAGAGPAPTAA
ncbi:hypothetical protein GCM10010174_27800 [Kutzneria viridogrisea]